MGRSVTKDLGGRPTKLSNEVVQKLEDIFKIGGTVDQAVNYARIARRTYYYWLEDDEDFAQKMQSAQEYADTVAKKIVVDAMTKGQDVATAKWWLEKREFKNSNQTNVQVNNFIPLLGGDSAKNVISENDSNREDTQTQQED